MRVEFENHSLGPDSSEAGNELRGKLLFVQFDRPASDAYTTAATVNVTIKTEGFQDIPVLTAVSLGTDNIWRPHAPVHDVDGVILGPPESTLHYLAASRVHLEVDGGGTGIGNFRIGIEK